MSDDHPGSPRPADDTPRWSDDRSSSSVDPDPLGGFPDPAGSNSAGSLGQWSPDLLPRWSPDAAPPDPGYLTPPRWDDATTSPLERGWHRYAGHSPDWQGDLSPESPAPDVDRSSGWDPPRYADGSFSGLAGAETAHFSDGSPWRDTTRDEDPGPGRRARGDGRSSLYPGDDRFPTESDSSGWRAGGSSSWSAGEAGGLSGGSSRWGEVSSGSSGWEGDRFSSGSSGWDGDRFATGSDSSDWRADGSSSWSAGEAGGLSGGSSRWGEVSSGSSGSSGWEGDRFPSGSSGWDGDRFPTGSDSSGWRADGSSSWSAGGAGGLSGGSSRWGEVSSGSSGWDRDRFSTGLPDWDRDALSTGSPGWDRDALSTASPGLPSDPDRETSWRWNGGLTSEDSTAQAAAQGTSGLLDTGEDPPTTDTTPTVWGLRDGVARSSGPSEWDPSPRVAEGAWSDGDPAPSWFREPSRAPGASGTSAFAPPGDPALAETGAAAFTATGTGSFTSTDPDPDVDPGSGEDEPPSRRARRGGPAWLPRNRRLLWGAVAVVTVLVLGAGLLTATYLKLDSNISRVDISASLGARPAKVPVKGPEKPLNILVMGSDTRKGIGMTEFGRDTIEGGAHSDTNLLVHLSADRTWATVVSIPRDSMTKAPADCSDPDSKVANGVVRQWNYNFHIGGPGCTIKTLEGLTDIYIDHFVVVNFKGFASMVDALGGVDVCTEVPINDEDSGLVLPAGRSHLDGKQALGYVRVRKTLNDGSDLHRIKRQQAFLSSVAQEATASSLLLRPDHLLEFLDAATKSITTDKSMSVGTMKDIATSIKDLGIGNIEFVTVPTETYAPDPNRVEWTSAAKALWTSIRNDQPLPGSKRAKELAKEKKASSTSTSTTHSLTVSPADIHVDVVNDAGTNGLAHQSASALAVQGFLVGEARDGDYGSVIGVVVRYPAGKKDAARTVAAAFKGSTIELDPGVSGVEVHLGMGAGPVVEVPNRTGSDPLPDQPVTAPPAPSTPPTPSVTFEARTAKDNICKTN